MRIKARNAVMISAVIAIGILSSCAEFGREYKKDRVGDFTVYRGSSAELRPEDLVAGK